ncbi:MAG TPA: sulfatase-like hydrolase/transferase, partial [Puia sp.]|nr:sulfatase-like hydrolase/transferase [Puia sp.]
MKFKMLTALFVAGFFPLHVNAQTKSNPKKPNIIFIVADDLGYGNLTSYNPSHKVPTPNIDRIGKEGIKFTQFYSGSTVCAPSRCALMTGKTMGHAYIRGNSLESLREQDTTLAQRLQLNGYVTGMYGKWGLGEEGTTGSPERKGFDEFFGYLNQTHAHDYFTSYLYEVKNRQIKKVLVDSALYAQNLIMDHALNFVQNNKDKPFFLFLPLTLTHAELRVPDSLMKPFLNADGSSKFEPEKPFGGRNHYDAQAKPHAAFAAMVTRLDSDVGRVLELIKKLGLDNNTYVFF